MPNSETKSSTRIRVSADMFESVHEEKLVHYLFKVGLSVGGYK